MMVLLLKMLATSSECLILWEAFQETFIPRARPATGTLVSKLFCFWLASFKTFPGDNQSFFEARSECEGSGGRLLDVSQQDELETITLLATAQGWTGR